MNATAEKTRDDATHSAARRGASGDNGIVPPGPSASGVEIVAKSIEALSMDLRDVIRRLQTLEATRAPAPAQPPAAPKSLFFVPVGLLLTLIAVLIVGLWEIIKQSHVDFGRGIDVATLGYSQGQSDATAMTRRIFLLACGHQIISFKAAAFVISALMFFVGAVFVLYKAEAPYDLRTESNTMKAELSTSSPGLVIITLSAALAIATLYAKSNVTDQFDFDLAAPRAVAEAAAPPAPTANAANHVKEDEVRRRIQAELDALNSSARQSKGGEP